MGKSFLDDFIANSSPRVDKEIRSTRIFYENMMSDKEININIGGGGSSKSHSIIQLLLFKFLTEENKKILIIRKTMPSIRSTVLIPFYEQLSAFGIRERVKVDKVGMNMFYGSNMIHFNGLDNPEKIKSSNWHYMWFEEATEIDMSDFNTVRLYLRAPSSDNKMNQIYLSFNPIDEFHWIKRWLIEDPSFSKDVKVIHSTYKDNPFLPEKAKQRYEELINQDINFYRIYALGEWGKLENLIYKNWEIVDSMPTKIPGARVVYGLDFGFNDPTVIIKSTVKDMDVYHEEILYKTGMTNNDLISFMKTNIPKSEWSKPWWADAQNPDKIREIRLAGFNIKAAQKNINDGIDLVKRFRQFILKTSSNLIKEYRAYSWRTDKNGNVLDEPVDFLNHGCDSTRYSLYSTFRGDGMFRVRWI
jgi:phage terminase large subunit